MRAWSLELVGAWGLSSLPRPSTLGSLDSRYPPRPGPRFAHTNTLGGSTRGEVTAAAHSCCCRMQNLPLLAPRNSMRKSQIRARYFERCMIFGSFFFDAHFRQPFQLLDSNTQRTPCHRLTLSSMHGKIPVSPESAMAMASCCTPCVKD